MATVVLPCCVVADCARLQWKADRCADHTHPRLCQVDDCGRRHWARGWCHLHYMRIQRRGTPDVPPGRAASVTAAAAEKRRRRRADLDRSAAIADAQLWAEEVVSRAILELEVNR